MNQIFTKDKENIYNLAPNANGGNSTVISIEGLNSISEKNRKCSDELLEKIKDQLEQGKTKKLIADELHINPNVLSQ